MLKSTDISKASELIDAVTDDWDILDELGGEGVSLEVEIDDGWSSTSLSIDDDANAAILPIVTGMVRKRIAENIEKLRAMGVEYERPKNEDNSEEKAEAA